MSRRNFSCLLSFDFQLIILITITLSDSHVALRLPMNLSIAWEEIILAGQQPVMIDEVFIENFF